MGSFRDTGQRMAVDGFFQIRIAYAGVDFGRRQVFVAQEFLNIPDVDVTLEQQGRKRVPQFVGAELATLAVVQGKALLSVSLDKLAHR